MNDLMVQLRDLQSKELQKAENEANNAQNQSPQKENTSRKEAQTSDCLIRKDIQPLEAELLYDRDYYDDELQAIDS